MILKQTRIRVGSAQKLLAHITSMKGNQQVEILYGYPTLPLTGDIIARMNDRKYGNRHIILSPEFDLNPKQLKFALSLIFRELDPKNGAADNYLLIKHHKRRHDGEHDAAHYHLILNETTLSGHQLDHRMSFLKNEKIARLCELKFGHPIIKGRHNKAVLHQLQADNYHSEAASLIEITKGPPAFAAFSSKQLRAAERLGVNLPNIYYQISGATDAAALQKSLLEVSKMEGISLLHLPKPRIFLLQYEGKTIANLFKFLKTMEIYNDYIKKFGTTQFRVPKHYNQNTFANSQKDL